MNLLLWPLDKIVSILQIALKQKADPRTAPAELLSDNQWKAVVLLGSSQVGMFICV